VKLGHILMSNVSPAFRGLLTTDLHKKIPLKTRD